MINRFINCRVKKLGKTIDINSNDVENSEKVLFSLFTRYGDTIIDLVVIKEFIEKFPEKYYLILCPKQMVPYVNSLLPEIEVFGFNKRNIFEFIKVFFLLKKENFDLGFNPWSNGTDSCYWISFCKKYFCYKNFNRPDVINHYEVVRKYLQLPSKEWYIKDFSLQKKYNNILICPESTDDYRSMSQLELKNLINFLIKRFPSSEIRIASLDKTYKLEGYFHYKFKKSSNSSKEFINLIKKSNFIFCVDSGPLHISTALGKDTIGVFNNTTPEFVINTNSKIKIIDKNDIVGTIDA